MKRREWRDLGLVLGLALALRLALWWVLPREALVSDEPEYLGAAWWLASGRGFSFYADWPWLRPPVYLLFLAPFLRLAGLNLLPLRLAQIALSLSVPALTYLLARESCGRQAARTAGLLAALWLPLAVLPHLVLAENLFLPLLLGGFYFLVRWQGALRSDVPSARGRLRRDGWALAGGVFLGLATMTRGLTTAFLPLAALWILLTDRQKRPSETQRNFSRRAFLLFTCAAALVILPWTGYNYLRYQRLILVDTTGGYNFWLGSQGGQFHNLRDVHRALLDLPDPAARQRYAYEQGWSAIAADPVGYLRNRAAELGQLLAINYGADERLLDGFVLGHVSIPHLLAVFLLEDTLYLFLVPLGLFGLFLQRGENGRGLAWLWLGYNLAMATAFFAINRFRLPVMPLLMVYAGAAVSRREAEKDGQEETKEPPRRRTVFLLRFGVALLLSLAFWAVVMPSYIGPYPASSGATVLGVRGRIAAGHLARAEAALAAGKRETAWEEIQAALAYRPDGLHPLPPALVVLAEWQRAGGDERAALDTLAGLDWYQAALLRGDMLRAQGDVAGAVREFTARQVAERDALPWAWEHLRPPATQEVDLGGGLDLGLVEGFYAPEREGGTTYRWSGAVARLRFPAAGTGQKLVLRLRLRGWRPAGERPAEVVLACADVEVARLTLGTEWQEVAVPLPPVAAGADVVVTLRTEAFFAGPRDLLQVGRLRMLGVIVDRGTVE